MAKTKKENLTKDLGTIALSIIIAIILAQTGTLKDFLFASQGREIFGTFIAGMFFTSLFTIAPAMVALAELAEVQPLWQLALVGATGAVLADYIIFRFIKDRLSADLTRYFHHIKILHWTAIRWVIFILGAFIVASPFPDELGLAMMGLTRMRTPAFLTLIFVLDFIGILAVGLVGRAI